MSDNGPWGTPKSKVKKVVVDELLAGKGRAGLVKPDEADMGIVRIANTPTFKDVPGLEQHVTNHESGHLEYGDNLHKNASLPRAGRAGDFDLTAEELNTLQKNPDLAQMYFNEVSGQLGEFSRDRQGPMGMINNIVNKFQETQPLVYESAMEFLAKRGKRPIKPDEKQKAESLRKYYSKEKAK